MFNISRLYPIRIFILISELECNVLELVCSNSSDVLFGILTTSRLQSHIHTAPFWVENLRQHSSTINPLTWVTFKEPLNRRSF